MSEQKDALSAALDALVEAAREQGRWDDSATRREERKARAAVERLARPAAPAEAQPVAYVPVHPRSGPLWAMTTNDPHPERLPSYPLMPLYAAPVAQPQAQTPQREVDSFGRDIREESLASIIRSLVSSLRRARPEAQVSERAMALLESYGLLGSPLRSDEAQP